jgi:hypothetical protein
MNQSTTFFDYCRTNTVLNVRHAQITAGIVVLTLVSAFLTTLALAETKTKTTSKAATVTVTAQTTKRASRQGIVRIGKVSWNCRGSRCTTRGPTTLVSVQTCKVLVKRVGQIRSYGYSGRKLSARQLEQCNARAAVAKTKTTTSPATKGTGKTGPKRPTVGTVSRRSARIVISPPQDLVMTGLRTATLSITPTQELVMTGLAASTLTISPSDELVMTGLLTPTLSITPAEELIMTGLAAPVLVISPSEELTMTGLRPPILTINPNDEMTMTGLGRFKAGASAEPRKPSTK